MTEIKVTHPNGYTGVLYGESSLSIFDLEGKECMHTGFRNANTEKELYELLEDYPDFINMLAEMVANDDFDEEDDI